VSPTQMSKACHSYLSSGLTYFFRGKQYIALMRGTGNPPPRGSVAPPFPPPAVPPPTPLPQPYRACLCTRLMGTAAIGSQGSSHHANRIRAANLVSVGTPGKYVTAGLPVHFSLGKRCVSTSCCSFFTVAANCSVAFSNALNASSHSICISA